MVIGCIFAQALGIVLTVSSVLMFYFLIYQPVYQQAYNIPMVQPHLGACFWQAVALCVTGAVHVC